MSQALAHSALGRANTDTGDIEFWFDFASNYSYLSIMRIARMAADAQANVLWRPFLLGPIFRAFGWESSPFVLQKLKGQYAWRDCARQCAKLNIPWKAPSVFPRNSTLASRVAVANQEAPWFPAFCREIATLNFGHDADIADPEVVESALNMLGLSGAELIAQASNDENRALLRQATQQAQARGIFGAPTFLVGEEVFWGNDRLEDAMHCLNASRAHSRTRHDGA